MAVCRREVNANDTVELSAQEQTGKAPRGD